MKLHEITDEQEPFVVTMLRMLLKKEDTILLVIVQDGGAAAVIGKIKGLKVEKDRKGHVEYVLNVFTNMEQDYAYSPLRLRRADIRQHKSASAKIPSGFRMVPALYIPAFGNTDDLGGHDT